MHRKFDKTFSVCDIIRIWELHLTDLERDEVARFFQVVLPALQPEFSTIQLLAAVIVKADIFGPWALFGQIADALSQQSALRQVTSRRTLGKMFITAGARECIFNWVRHYRGRKLIA